MTPREAALAARVAELEAAAGRRVNTGGNVVEQTWRYFSYLVPPSLMVAGLLVFGVFHVFTYYNGSEKAAFETRIKQAKATKTDADAGAAKMIVNGNALPVEALRAQAKLKQLQADNAKIEADALNSQIDGVRAEVRRVQLDVENTELAAKRKALEARAAMDKLGGRDKDGQTLEDQIAEYKLYLTEFEGILEAYNAAAAATFNPSSKRAADALCNNRWAEVFKCPAAYVARLKKGGR
jgi:hypothetical protein